MTVGLSVTNVANRWLATLQGTSWSTNGTVYVQLHVGDPGAAGTLNTSQVGQRVLVSFTAPSGGALALNASEAPQWSMTSSETISAISHWDSPSAGNFLWSSTLTQSQPVNPGDTFSLTSDGLSLAPLASTST